MSFRIAELEQARALLQRCVEQCGADPALLQDRDADFATYVLAYSRRQDQGRQQWLLDELRQSLAQVGGQHYSTPVANTHNRPIATHNRPIAAESACGVLKRHGQEGSIAEAAASHLGLAAQVTQQIAKGCTPFSGCCTLGIVDMASSCLHCRMVTARLVHGGCDGSLQDGAWPHIRMEQRIVRDPLPATTRQMAHSLEVWRRGTARAAADAEGPPPKGAPQHEAVPCTCAHAQLLCLTQSSNTARIHWSPQEELCASSLPPCSGAATKYSRSIPGAGIYVFWSVLQACW